MHHDKLWAKFHHLWSTVTANEGYKKEEWKELESLIFRAITSPVQIPPVEKITCEVDRLRVVAYMSDALLLADGQFDKEAMHEDMKGWLRAGPDRPTLCVAGISKIELYQFPERKES